MFTYSSIQTHGIHTPNGEKIKETIVKVKNGKGTKCVRIRDNDGYHTTTLPLKKSEIKNIELHRFMPKLFVKPTRLVRYKKSETRRRNNRTRKHK